MDMKDKVQKELGKVSDETKKKFQKTSISLSSILLKKLSWERTWD